MVVRIWRAWYSREYEPASNGTLIISDNDLVKTIQCNGEAVSVNGNSNVLTILGTCSSLTVKGNGNWISIQSHPAVVITDSGNDHTIIEQ